MVQKWKKDIYLMYVVLLQQCPFGGCAKIIYCGNLPPKTIRRNPTRIYPNTKKGLEDALDSIKKIIGEEGLFILYITGHACWNDEKGDVYLRMGSPVNGREIAGFVRQMFSNNRKIFVADTCFSYHFVAELLDPNSIGISASSPRCPTYQETFPTAFWLQARMTDVATAFHRAYSRDENRISGNQTPQLLMYGEDGVIAIPGFSEEARNWVPGPDLLKFPYSYF